MTTRFYRKCFYSLTVAALLTANAYADTFEFLSYTPPSGWTKQAASEGTVYRRMSGIGAISFYSSYSATGSAPDEFAKTWRSRLGSVVPGPAPQPQINRDSDYSVAVGAQQVDAQGTITTISLVTFVGRGRALGVLTMTAGDDALREVTAFFDSLKIAPAAVSTSGSTSAGGIEVEFEVPPGYVSQRDGNTVVLKPTRVDRNTPCVYGISAARPSRGKLETDAASAILEPLPGWSLKSEHYNAMRGVSGAGWPYYWVRTDVRRLVGPSYENLTAMAMAFPAGAGRVNILWGFGATGVCSSEDLAFSRLFHSLRPRGWTSDGGRALAAELRGTWRNSESSGMAQYKFFADGRYEYGQGTSTTFSTLETRTGQAAGGRYEIRGGELSITGGRGAAKFRVRIYDEFSGGIWVRTLSLIDERANPPLSLRYMRVQD